MINKIIIKETELPEVWHPKNMPLINEEEYEVRLKKLREFMYNKEFDFVVIYGDMGQFANINFFTGFNATMEEAMLVVGLDDNPFLILGNEMLDLSKNATYKKLNRLLFQTFSPTGQPYSTSIDLKKVFNEIGIKKDKKIGIIGNKFYYHYKNSNKIFDLPYYIIETLIAITGKNRIFNITYILSDCTIGFKNNLSSIDIAFMEYSAGLACYGINNILRNLRIGQNEVEASSLFKYTGEVPFFAPWGIAFGYPSSEIWDYSVPRHNSILKLGDTVHLAALLRGSCIAKVGIAVNNFKELNEINNGLIEILYEPYYSCLVRWYENIKIGITGGELYEKIRDFIENPDFDIFLKSAGHSIHYEEWVNTPLYKNSKINLHSGIAIQCDIFAQLKKLNAFTIVEDGIVLADDTLKLELRKNFPQLMNRFNNRRKFMKEQLGINLHESVLPLNDLQAVMYPYFLNVNYVMAIE